MTVAGAIVAIAFTLIICAVFFYVQENLVKRDRNNRYAKYFINRIANVLGVT
jgi:hypothetical protein